MTNRPLRNINCELGRVINYEVSGVVATCGMWELIYRQRFWEKPMCRSTSITRCCSKRPFCQTEGLTNLIEILENYPTAEAQVNGDKLMQLDQDFPALASRLPRLPYISYRSYYVGRKGAVKKQWPPEVG